MTREEVIATCRSQPQHSSSQDAAPDHAAVYRPLYVVWKHRPCGCRARRLCRAKGDLGFPLRKPDRKWNAGLEAEDLRTPGEQDVLGIGLPAP